MIKKHNSLMRVVPLSLVLLITFAVSSCKKGESVKPDPVQSAKDWYTKSTRAQATIKSDNNVERKVNKTVDWDNAQTVTLLNGSEVVTAPLSVEYIDGVKPSGSYMLIITKTGAKNTAMVVYDARNDYFNGNLTQSDVTAIYKNFEAQNLTHKEAKLLQAKNKKDNIGIKNEPLPPVCNDFYWVEIEYDIEGNVIGYDEWYLFTACGDDGGGGGGGGGETEPAPVSWGVVDDTDGSTSLFSTDSAGNEIHNVNWTCYKINGNQMWFQSYEKASIAKMGIPDHYAYWVAGLQHVSITPTGELDAGESAELLLNYATNVSTEEYFQMELSVKEKRTRTQDSKTTVSTSGAKLARSRAWTLYYFGH